MKRKIRNDKSRKRTARRARIAKSMRGGERPRLTVFRSAKHIYAQLTDPRTGKTLGVVSTRSTQIAESAKTAGKTEAARSVGKAVAEMAREKQISQVVFNRNGFLFHGRVKALADAARKAGLDF